MSMTNNAPLIDHEQRVRAVDPSLSCIVQAPAGSGKTTLLVERYLNLLATVNRPEEILAITFTNKAAAEMRSRVLDALNAGVDGPASAVKARSQEQGWQLERYPNRLRIQTIDAFATFLVGQLPVTAGIAQLPIHPNPTIAYETAVNRVFHAALRNNSDLMAQFMALNNHREAPTRGLLQNMLARREQWLHLLVGTVSQPSTDQLATQLNAAVADIQTQAVAALRSQLGEALFHELSELANFALSCLQTDPARGDDLATELEPIDGPPSALQWRFLANLLVTQSATLGQPKGRTKPNVANGFPTQPADIASAGTTKEAAKAHKGRITSLLKAQAKSVQLQKAAVAVRDMPVGEITDTQLDDLQVIATLLLQSVAELTRVFNETGQIDFNQITLSAIAALGDAEHPTDLALNLDYRISHLLIDEFQDTSRAHFELFNRIMQGWQIDDGRTFFAVGDPMQSVYRFRNAEVAMFLDCTENGINNRELEVLRLSTNFRSQPALIDYFNTSFNTLLLSLIHI